MTWWPIPFFRRKGSSQTTRAPSRAVGFKREVRHRWRKKVKPMPVRAVMHQRRARLYFDFGIRRAA